MLPPQPVPHSRVPQLADTGMDFSDQIIVTNFGVFLK